MGTAVRRTVSIPEFALITGIGRGTAYRLAAEGNLPGAIRLGGRVVVSVDALDELLRPHAKEKDEVGAPNTHHALSTAR